MNGNEDKSGTTEKHRDSSGDYVLAELVEGPSATAGMRREAGVPGRPTVRRRRIKLPLFLFLLTCLSTFWAGAGGWYAAPDAMLIRRVIVSHWQDGLIYMACILAILLTHEMGHFLATLRYGIPASLPFFIPFPISPVGTMGAVIGMDGRRADRKQMFDIGLAGPLAGLAVAIPILLVGIHGLDSSGPGYGPFRLDLPLVVRSVLAWNPPAGYHVGVADADQIWFSHLNPFFMAGWVGLLVTGLNMLPVSQLDGGHVSYALFGRHSRWVAYGFMLVAVGYLILTGTWDRWVVMILLILLIGIHHPPTRDDTVKLGWLRITLGLASLAIPLLCLPPQVLHIVD
jgi:Zn-dependent protease